MKKLIIITSILCVTFLPAWSQIRFDIKAGMSFSSSPSTANILVNRSNPHEEFQLNMIKVKPQFYGGIAVNVGLSSPFFLEGGVSYTKRTSTYMVEYRMAPEIGSSTQYMDESENMILLPVNVGVSIGKVDLTSGLTASRTISSIKQLTHLKGFHQDANGIKLGWQMGARFAVKRAMIGVEYQASLSRVGQGMYVNDQSLELMNIPGQFVFGIQYKL